MFMILPIASVNDWQTQKGQGVPRFWSNAQKGGVLEMKKWDWKTLLSICIVWGVVGSLAVVVFVTMAF
jgi:hypothetical protein